MPSPFQVLRCRALRITPFLSLPFRAMLVPRRRLTVCLIPDSCVSGYLSALCGIFRTAWGKSPASFGLRNTTLAIIHAILQARSLPPISQELANRCLKE